MHTVHECKQIFTCTAILGGFEGGGCSSALSGYRKQSV